MYTQVVGGPHRIMSSMAAEQVWVSSVGSSRLVRLSAATPTRRTCSSAAMTATSTPHGGAKARTGPASRTTGATSVHRRCQISADLRIREDRVKLLLHDALRALRQMLQEAGVAQ